MCNCAQRRMQGQRAVRAMRGGDFGEARRQIGMMAQSAAQDIRVALRQDPTPRPEPQHDTSGF